MKITIPLSKSEVSNLLWSMDIYCSQLAQELSDFSESDSCFQIYYLRQLLMINTLIKLGNRLVLIERKGDTETRLRCKQSEGLALWEFCLYGNPDPILGRKIQSLIKV